MDAIDSLGAALLELVERRWDSDPSYYYPFAAAIIAQQQGKPFPDFVTGALFLLAWKTLVEPQTDDRGYELELGRLPPISSNHNRQSDQWARFADCRELLLAWLSRDESQVEAAFEKQGRQASQDAAFVRRIEERPKGVSLEAVFGKLSDGDPKGRSADTFERRYKALTAPDQPLVLVRDGDGYLIGRRDVRSGTVVAEHAIAA